MKKVIISILSTLLLALGGTYAYQNLGSGNTADNYQILTGTQASYTRLPMAYVEADSTTTAGFTDGGTVTQIMDVSGFTDYTFIANVKGGRATSTVCLKPMWSIDGSYWWPRMTHSTTTALAGTTTPALANQAYCSTVGTASTTMTIEDVVPAARYGRFLISSNYDADPTNFVKGLIIVSLGNNSGSAR